MQYIQKRSHLLQFLDLRCTTFAATRHDLWALNTPKMRYSRSPGHPHIFMYLELRERVWWLQMSSFPLRELIAVPQILQLDLRDHFEAGKDRTERKRGKRNGSGGTDRTGQNTRN